MNETKLYQKIFNSIIKQIRDMRFLPGDKLPTEEELMSIYSCSRTTIRKAMKKMEESNLIYRIKKAGTFLNGYQNTKNFAKIMPLVIPGENELSNVIQTTALINNCFTPVFVSENNSQKEREILNEILNMEIDALLLYPASKLANSDLISLFCIKNIPIIFIDRNYVNIDSPFITTDNKWEMANLVNYLISIGHTKIGYLYIAKTMHYSEQERFTGYCKSLIKKGIPLNNDYIFEAELNIAGQTNVLQEVCEITADKIIKMPDPPTAICCTNDNVARALINCLKNKGIICPKDISITGFDNSSIAYVVEPQITTVAQSFKKLGERTIEIALRVTNNQSVSLLNSIPGKAIIGSSTAPLKE